MSDSKKADTDGQWWVYIILSLSGRLYTGISTDVDRRFQEHLDSFNKKPNAKGAKFFRSDRPVEVVYKESLDNRSQASSREYSIKAMSKKQKLALIASVN